MTSTNGDATPGRACPTFRSRLATEDWEAFASRTRRHTMSSDTVLFSQGGAEQDAAVIAGGWVKIVVHGADGNASTLALRGPGDIIGEMALLGSAPRSAEVRSVGKLEVLRIAAADFRGLLEQRPGISMTLLGVLTDRLRHADRWRVRCGTWSVEQRLTTLLTELIDMYKPRPDSGGVDFTLPFSQSELGEFIGGSRKSVSRTLYELRRDRVVHTARRSISVLEPAELRRRAGCVED